MDLTFLTPGSGLVALLVLVPLLALLRTHRVGARVRRAIGLVDPRRRTLVWPLAALGATAGFLGLAAMQPVVSKDETRRVRTDAETFVVFDVSRSMLASSAAGEPSRLARSKTAALNLREAVPTVPFGAASVTDRTLPHLFPTGDQDVFRATLQKAIGIERPPPVHSLLRRVTSLESLGAVASQSFFSPGAKRRVLVVFTDGETLPGTRARLGPLFQRPPGISTVFVHVWGRDERVYLRRAPEIGYPRTRARAIRSTASRQASAARSCRKATSSERRARSRGSSAAGRLSSRGRSGGTSRSPRPSRPSRSSRSRCSSGGGTADG